MRSSSPARSDGEPSPSTRIGRCRCRTRFRPSSTDASAASLTTRGLLAVVAALSEPTISLVEAAGVADALDDAVRGGILVSEAESVRFEHPLLASGAYALFGPRARRELHRRLATLVADEEERARHLALGSDGPSEDVAKVVDDAARAAAARGAIAAAADLFAKAAELTPSDAFDELWMRRAEAVRYDVRAGDMERARAAIDALLDRGVPLEASAVGLLSLARIEGSIERTANLCDRAIASATTDELRAEAHQLASETAMHGGDVPKALEHARTAVELAERAGAMGLLVESLGTLCAFETYAGAFTPGLMEGAVDLERRVARPSHNYSPREVLGVRLMYSDRLDEARAALEESVVATTELGDEADRSSLLNHLTQLECRAGRLARAVERARELQIVIGQMGIPQWMLPYGGFARGLVAAHLGHVEEALEAASAGVAASMQVGTNLFHVLNRWVLGFLELSLGDAQAADQHLHSLPGELEDMGYRNRACGRCTPTRSRHESARGISRSRWARAARAPGLRVGQPLGDRSRKTLPRPPARRGRRRVRGDRAARTCAQGPRAIAAAARAGPHAPRTRHSPSPRQAARRRAGRANGRARAVRPDRNSAVGGEGGGRAGTAPRPPPHSGPADGDRAARRRARRPRPLEQGNRGAALRNGASRRSDPLEGVREAPRALTDAARESPRPRKSPLNSSNSVWVSTLSRRRVPA